jgi:hypothetical protein
MHEFFQFFATYPVRTTIFLIISLYFPFQTLVCIFPRKSCDCKK